MVSILLNGVDWTGKITDLSLQVKDMKQSYTNVKGDGLTVPPRSQVSGKAFKLTFMYLSREDYLLLKALYDGSATVTAVFTGFDIPSGDYLAVEFSMQLVKVLSGIAYNTYLILQQDSNPQVPGPKIPSNPFATTSFPSKLGL